MTSSRRRKLLIGMGTAVCVLVAALLLAPSFYDLNRQKPVLAALVKQATGRALVIDGPARWSLLPTPHATVSGVTFFNAPGAKNPNMVEVKSIEVRPALLPLLTGRLEVAEVTLVEPKIVLEINAQGKPNWEFTPSVAEAQPVAPKPGSPAPLSLGKLAIENGTLVFSDSSAGLAITAERANLTASVGSPDGPFALAGSATMNGAPLKIDLGVGAKSSDGFASRLALEAAGGKLDFKGKLSELGPNARLSGRLDAAADSLTTFAATLIGLAGRPVPPMPALLASKFSFAGDIDLAQTQFAARDFKLTLAGDSGSGSIAVTLKPALAIDGKLSLPRIDLDRVLAGLTSPPAAPATGKPPSPPASGSGASMFDALTAKLSLDAQEVIYNKQAVKNVALELDAKGGVVAVPRLNALLPGDMVLQARSTLSGDPARPAVSGEFSLTGPKLRETLTWLDVDLSSVPPNRLQRLSLKGRLGSSGGAVQVKDAVFELDDARGTGGITVTLSLPIAIETELDIDTVDIDSFIAKPAEGQKRPAVTAVAVKESPRPANGPTIGLKLRLNRAIYNRDTIGGIAVDLVRKGHTVEIRDLAVSNLVGARLALRGAVSDYDQPLPHANVAFNLDAPDLSRLLKLVGTAAPAEVIAVAAKGGISGTVEALTVRELDIVADGQAARVDGTLTMPGAAKGPPSTIGYKGKVTANGQTIEGTVEATVASRPHVTADLRTSLLDLDRLGRAAATPAPQRAARPSAAASKSAAEEPIDTAVLRAFDASFKLAASTLVSAPFRLNNADIALTLKDGLLTVQHLKGGLYGGAVDLSGTIDGRKTLAIDLKGDARDVYLGELLRGTAGTNIFGGTIKITVDGRLSATGISVKGSGATRGQLRGSMTGGAQLGGHVFVGADKALTTIGSAATGALGGVIDNTLGNVLGAVGQRGIATNLLTASSVLLNRFVNRNNPIAGHVDIAGGMLTDKNLVVSGDRASANIATRTNLAASTTDTTINFVLAEDPSAPYIVASVRGSLASPSYGVSRGSAKDPPGVVNTLTNVVPNVVPGLGNAVPHLPIPNVPLPNIFGR